MRLTVYFHTSLLSLWLTISITPLKSHADFTEGDYTYTTNASGQAVITGFNSAFSGELSITNTLGGRPVTAIGNNAFGTCSGLTRVIMPDSVTDIGDEAFCSISESWIGFEDDGPSYETIELDFIGGGNLTSVKFGNGVTRIGHGAFYACTGLTNITIPDSVTNIEEYAFLACTNMTNLTIGNRVTCIGNEAFQYCSGLTSVTIPSSVVNIGNYAFSDCSRLSSLSISGGVTNIGDFAFQYCKLLASITIPSAVARIGYCAFFRCPLLTTISVDTSNAYYYSDYGVLLTKDTKTLVNCPGGKAGSVAIHSRVTNIQDAAFAACTRLTNILFQGNAPTIGGLYAFYDTPATVYYLPGSTGWGATFAGRPTLCWNPKVLRDASLGFTDDRFCFNVAGTTNIPVAIEASTNLSDGVWTPLTNATLGTAGSFRFSDPASTNLPARFYRMVWP